MLYEIFFVSLRGNACHMHIKKDLCARTCEVNIYIIFNSGNIYEKANPQIVLKRYLRKE